MKPPLVIDGHVGVHGQLVVVWCRPGRIQESRFPVNALAEFHEDAAMFIRDRKVARVERRLDGVVVERIEGVR
jgi:hypothetical protein